ncbi:hypothetical protein Lmor_0813 [Legionella moravica]|uniref:Protein of uncharacterized function (DUF2878) n=1 Tax=Legionella moravica TaxID=39962 RepID=A0A378JWT7_9GAMM|nr:MULTISPECIES: DUF2878 family protein [Legionella]KTD35366.1 hypothetical protein Lmor_0813 [Legionella moravica]RUR19436.1 DUF2878 family protein [Legionella sp. km535]STX61972.1 Protein of uncharacterised function (DUF2878) [Legionella moravica]
MNKILVIYTYYIVWFGSLILAANHFAWLPLLLSLSISAIQLYFWCDLSKVKNWKLFMFYLSSLGFLCDSLFAATSFIYFQPNPFQPYLAPPWMLGFWINFSVLCICLVDLLNRIRRLLWLIALIGFPAAYLGGVGFHVAVFQAGTISSIILGIIWMVLFPFLCHKLLFKPIHSLIKD